MLQYIVSIGETNIALNYLNNILIKPFAAKFFLTTEKKVDITINIEVLQDRVITEVEKFDLKTSAWRMKAEKNRKIFDFIDNNIVIANLYVNDDCTECNLKILKESMHDIVPPVFVMVPILSGYLLTHKKGLIFHGSLIKYKNTGILFTGESGAGKSTISEIFKSCGYNKIGDDRLILSKKSDAEKVHAYSTPFDLKLSHWVNDNCSISAIILLKHSENGYNYLNRKEEFSTIAQLAISNFLPFYNFKKINEYFNMFYETMQNIPIFEYSFLPNKTCVDYLEKNLKYDF